MGNKPFSLHKCQHLGYFWERIALFSFWKNSKISLSISCMESRQIKAVMFFQKTSYHCKSFGGISVSFCSLNKPPPRHIPKIAHIEGRDPWRQNFANLAPCTAITYWGKTLQGCNHKFCKSCTLAIASRIYTFFY